MTHSEDVSPWAKAIRQWFAVRSDTESVSLIELQNSLGMPLFEVYLGLLLGNRFELKQQKNCYDQKTIWVSSV
ncbi:MAG: hypothetical protein BRC34_10535 [Cyanobacteria bacterium QH_1_48_107]|nr:MAG: hypothetical protein BRC34_10535 [Cyanobacteria bacterium QH_1_48_107]